ncbi:MAG: DUF5700 domain-containing putative Zn-dependent protease [Clostridium sp.]|uniref:DUF5700 domain-containing putative Zn-dependent protease n=1 Tax=Clostridium sp. TaxID=1506 RepID=UPI003069E943
MNITVNQNKKGIDDFINIFKSNSIIGRTDIEELFNSESHEKLVISIGKNVGLTEKKQWIDLFYEAYNLNLKSECYTGNDVVKINMISPIIWAIKNIDKLDDYTNRIIEIIDKNEYLEKTFEYLPTINHDININMNYYIFMYNASVYENDIFMDVAFATRLSEPQLNSLLAHEMHHYLKDSIDISTESKPEYKDVIRAICTLENEGTADMCSFHGLCHLYEDFGWMEKGILNEVLNNSTEYINILNRKLKDRLINNDDTIKIYDFIMGNQIVHPLGYKMASDIENYLGIDVLKECTGKPLEFILKFNLSFELSTGKKAFDQQVIDKLYFIFN